MVRLWALFVVNWGDALTMEVKALLTPLAGLHRKRQEVLMVANVLTASG